MSRPVRAGSSGADSGDATYDVALSVLHQLRDGGYEAFFVGGWVRDRLLGRPSKDIDVATSATPDDVSRLFSRVIPVGVEFGVCRVRRRGIEIEVATFRADASYKDGRRPESVQFTSAREDVLRRDFTVNGLLYDPDSDEIIDHVGGRADLDRHLIRAIGDPDARFAEDRLRMLRAVRFAARLGFTIDPATREAIRRHASAIVVVSAERIRDELRRVLADGGAALGLDLLDELGLLEPILPEVAALRSRQMPGGDDALTRTRTTLALLPDGASEALGLATLLHQMNGNAAREICRRLHLSRKTVETVSAAVDALPSCEETPSWPLSRLKRLLRKPHAETLIRLHALTTRASAGAPSEAALFLNDALGRFTPDELHPTPLLTGHDLPAMGYPPGPHYREMLHELETAQLDGQIADTAAARRFITERFGPPTSAGDAPDKPGDR